MSEPSRLSKSRFAAGLQCHRRLWWQVHEPGALELEPDAATGALFDQGTRVGELARSYLPGGVLVDLPHDQIAERVAATREALATGVSTIYEASFMAERVFAAVDILLRRHESVTLVEVK